MKALADEGRDRPVSEPNTVVMWIVAVAAVLAFLGWLILV
jgi:hypothetical protein